MSSETEMYNKMKDQLIEKVSQFIRFVESDQCDMGIIHIQNLYTFDIRYGKMDTPLYQMDVILPMKFRLTYRGIIVDVLQKHRNTNLIYVFFQNTDHVITDCYLIKKDRMLMIAAENYKEESKYA